MEENIGLVGINKMRFRFTVIVEILD